MPVSTLIPVNVITGFLGSGKTTLLNHLVRRPAMADTLVVINEFGDIGLDHRLLVEGDDQTVVELSSGCLCCTLRGDLSRTLQQASEAVERGETRAFRRVLIETSGLADPAPILHTLMTDHWLAQRFRLDGVVCLVDAANGLATLDAHRESRRQAAIADRLLISKADLVSEDHLSRLMDCLGRLNPAAEQLQVCRGVLAPDLMIGAGLHSDDGRPRIDGWLRPAAYPQRRLGDLHAQAPHPEESPHADGIQAFCFSVAEPIRPEALENWLELLMSLMGERVLRLKAVVHLTDRETPMALHGVQHIFHPPAPLPREAAPDGISRFVFITHDIEAETVSELFHYFHSAKEPDT
ncbi:CobW family GTP-binding protein [Halomonas sp. THAF12]|uniref:CobW family GTP-binding protein n=1 Tax=Halomonas sp. B23F22_10 TaxID=3459515 RepID=UPI00373F11C4